MFHKTLRPLSAVCVAALAAACNSNNSGSPASVQDALATATPIKHLVVIYGENVSFDHYFATYPQAANPNGEPQFTAAAATPGGINTLATAKLLTNNPNSTNTANGSGAVNPFRLDRAQAATADQNHGYAAEQRAYDNGLADLFPKYTGNGTSGGTGAFGTTGQVMGYYDGNTVTGLWNYAQAFAMSDNAYTDTYGPSTPGALEAVSGQTNGVNLVKSSKSSYYVVNADGSKTLISDVDPAADICSSATDQVQMSGKNIGDLLNAAGVTWGSFMGGFDLTRTNANSTTDCQRSTFSQTVNGTIRDYIPHHAWFQYYASTVNPQHTRPSSTARIGYNTETDGATAEPANHEYDINDFYAAVVAGNYPSVSYLKAPSYQDGHAGYSDPLDEQAFVAQVVNFLEQRPDWGSTAVIVAYDDSDGWYDHAYATPKQSSYDTSADQLNGAGTCGSGTAPQGLSDQPVNGRCGPGTRVPFLVISPWAKTNYVDHTLISQASIVKFIEDNWLGGKRLGSGAFDASSGSIAGLFNFSGGGNVPKLYVDPVTGLVLSAPPAG